MLEYATLVMCFFIQKQAYLYRVPVYGTLVRSLQVNADRISPFDEKKPDEPVRWPCGCQLKTMPRDGSDPP